MHSTYGEVEREKPMVLGGECELENIEKTNAEVHFSITGQVHLKVKDLPSGTIVDKVIIG